MGSRFSQIWRRRDDRQGEMSNFMDSDFDFQDSNDSDEEDSNTLRMILTMAMLRGGRIPSSRTDRDSSDEMANVPCPNRIEGSDLHQTILINQGNPLSSQQKGKHCNAAFKIRQREIQRRNDSSYGSFTHGLCTQLSTHFIPNHVKSELTFGEKNFCGTYSDDGQLFLSACQDDHVRVYDSNKFGTSAPFKDITARDVGWSVLDVAFSSDTRLLAYSSWSQYIHLCSIFDGDDPNLVQHEALLLNPEYHSFAVFSLQFTKDSSEILCGTNDGCLYIYSLVAGERILKIDAHEDDVNAVCFADSRSQIIYSGGDDGLVKVWDRRLLSDTSTAPVGVLAGHQDGITFIDTVGDARYLLSNSKDQSIKLWDIRCFSSNQAIENVRQMVARQTWDYRWEAAPRTGHRRQTIPGDTSVFTYTGHRVMNTLIRARFSPLFSTGNKYIYCGCSTGKFFVYDVLTGEVVSKMKEHSRCVRDISWHPYEQKLITSSWEGSVKLWEWKGQGKDT